jgi:hypothetical protein
MAFTNYRSIADVLRSFPLTYQEQDLISGLDKKLMAIE